MMNLVVPIKKAKNEEPWIGVDFDKTLAENPKNDFKTSDLEPIPLMVDRVKKWLKEGKDVRILTARVSRESFSKKKVKKQKKIIEKWCKEHLGRVLPVTSEKNHTMIALYDDRAHQVIADTGRLVK